MIYSSQPARFSLMNPLMHAVCYTHPIFIMFSYFFFKLLLLLSGDISLKPCPAHINQTSDNNSWNVSKARGLHFIHINIIAFYLKLKNFPVLLVSLTQLLLGFQNQNQTIPYLIRRLKLMALIFCILTETYMEEDQLAM